LKANQGKTSLALRFQLAQKAFAHTADYDRAIADYLGATAYEQIKRCYP
jgi:phosphoribosylaminoimidazolecarboxamide formyltransferase/IMP cyclohydrolase